MSHRKPRKPADETRYCARCLRAIPRAARAVIDWQECPGVDPTPVAYCSDACRDADRAEQAAYEREHWWVGYRD